MSLPQAGNHKIESTKPHAFFPIKGRAKVCSVCGGGLLDDLHKHPTTGKPVRAFDTARRTRLHRALDAVMDRKAAAKDAKPTFTFEQFVVKNPYMLGKYQKDIPAQRAVVAKAFGEQAAKHYEKEQQATNKAYASFYDHYLQCCKIDMPPSWAQAHDAQGSGARLTQINKEYNKLSAQQSKLTEKLIAEGHGHVRHSDLSATGSHTATEWLRLSSELGRLRAEGERIWGPGYNPRSSTYYHPKTIMARDSTPGSGKSVANARHALYNAGRAVQQSNFRSAVVWFRKAEELFKESGMQKEANLAAGKAMEAESYAGKKDVDHGS